MSVLPSNSFQFPTEILEKIIREYWALPLSTHERVLFMRDSMLVNSTWMSLYMHASCTDVHIPNSRYFLKLMSIFQRESIIYNMFAPDLHDSLCRSITFRSDYDSGPVEMFARTITQFISIETSRLPHLRRFSFELVDQKLNAIFPIRNPIRFPPSITTLEVLFYYSYSMLSCPQSVENVMFDVEPSGLKIESLPYINTLRVYGASAGGMRDLVLACIRVRVRDSDVSDHELLKRLRRGYEREASQEALDDEISMRIQAQRLVDEGTDEEVLEAVGVKRIDEIPSALIELRNELVVLLEKEQRGDVDVLKRRFVEKGIRVSEKAAGIYNDVRAAAGVGLSASSLEIEKRQPRAVTHDTEISPLTKISASHNNASNSLHVQSHTINATDRHFKSHTSPSFRSPWSDSSACTRSHVNIDDRLRSHVSTNFYPRTLFERPQAVKAHANTITAVNFSPEAMLTLSILTQVLERSKGGDSSEDSDNAIGSGSMTNSVVSKIGEIRTNTKSKSKPKSLSKSSGPLLD
ncbi:hypothetical protein K435DRAFT_785839 [Dendrothele bispora CBS 962.96]|uniref:Uncharacterized protein n=1 Tax=Dendrothele bispora (strain CBS 962.96) TaxID=1314807 RepID=A0A4V4HBH7_DENBC|nr:hypothetical protein K435DRAFT_785839 [Dendrothele bispora CBS 962.96]